MTLQLTPVDLESSGASHDNDITVAKPEIRTKQTRTGVRWKPCLDHDPEAYRKDSLRIGVALGDVFWRSVLYGRGKGGFADRVLVHLMGTGLEADLESGTSDSPDYHRISIDT